MHVYALSEYRISKLVVGIGYQFSVKAHRFCADVASCMDKLSFKSESPYNVYVKFTIVYN